MATFEERRSTCSTCLCQTCDNVRKRIDQAFKVLDKYEWLLDAYIVDFYEQDLWKRLPSSWAKFFEDTSPRELGSWILNENRSNRVWPLSLEALRRVVGLLQLNRYPNSDKELRCENPKKTRSALQSKESKCGIERRKRNSNGCTSHPRLKNLFAKHVKPKKKHEIDVMAKIIAGCAASSNSECAVDVGAGMGHLARTLAYKYEMCVTCVEQESVLSEQARKLDSNFETMALKYVPELRAQKPEHVWLKLEVDSESGASIFVEQLDQKFQKKFKLDKDLSGFGLIGLHPCGNLATTLLQCYAGTDRSKFICVAGCCYFKLTLGDDSGTPGSYPLSDYLRSSKINKLSYEALEVACHAIENHCQKLKSADYSDLKIHAYRAALESLLVEKDPALRHGPVKSVKLKRNTTFQEYCTSATEVLAVENRPSTLEEFQNPRIVEFLNNWERVVIFGSLRLMLAPLVESVVLLDRFLYLSERNLSPRLKAVFDPHISPRNFVITSVK